MKAIAILILFIGTILLIQGYYQKATTCANTPVQIKYVEKPLIDRQYGQDSQLEKQFGSMFGDVTTFDNSFYSTASNKGQKSNAVALSTDATTGTGAISDSSSTPISTPIVPTSAGLSTPSGFVGRYSS